LLYVPLPTPNDRVSILQALAVTVNLGPDVDLKKLAHSARAEGYSGADCAALLREAGLAVLKEDVGAVVVAGSSPALCIAQRHFDYAFSHVVPSVSRKDQARYDRMRNRMAHARSRGAMVSEPTEESEDNNLDVTMIDAPSTDDLLVDCSQLSTQSIKEDHVLNEEATVAETESGEKPVTESLPTIAASSLTPPASDTPATSSKGKNEGLSNGNDVANAAMV
jgi:hypothetical protein